jgi:hypothetical protein
MTEDLDWQCLYQSRSWVQKLLSDPELSAADVSTRTNGKPEPGWKVSGQDILLIVRNMILENGVFHRGYTTLIFSRIPK